MAGSLPTRTARGLALSDMMAGASASSRTDRVAAGRVRVVYRNVPVGVLGALFGVAVLSWVLIYADPGSAGRVEAWFGFTVLVAAWQLVLWRLYWRAKP